MFFGIGVDVLSHGDGDFTSIARVDYGTAFALKREVLRMEERGKMRPTSPDGISMARPVP